MYKMAKNKKAELKALAGLNATCFGSDDYYSSEAYVLHMLVLKSGEYFLIKKEGSVVGYILLKLDQKGYHCVRRGVVPSARRQGLGTKLSKKGVAFARKEGEYYNTYMALDNYASMNSNIRAGLEILKIDDEWVYMRAE